MTKAWTFRRRRRWRFHFDAVGTSWITVYPQNVEIIFGENGLLSSHTKGKTIIVMSTLAPDLMGELGKKVEAESDLKLISAAVSGGASGAQAGTLSIMTSGAEDIVKSFRPNFDAARQLVEYVAPHISATVRFCSGRSVSSEKAGSAKRGRLARRLVGDGPLRRRYTGFAGAAIEHEQIAGFGWLNDCRNDALGGLQIDRRRLGREIHVPEIVMHRLIRPRALACVDVESQKPLAYPSPAIRVQVSARAAGEWNLRG